MSWRQFEDLVDASRNRLGDSLFVNTPSVILQATTSVGEFYLRRRHRQSSNKPTLARRMIHIGKNTKSTIISKGIFPQASGQKNKLPREVKIHGRAQPTLGKLLAMPTRMLIRRPAAVPTRSLTSRYRQHDLARSSTEASTSKVGERSDLITCVNAAMSD